MLVWNSVSSSSQTLQCTCNVLGRYITPRPQCVDLPRLLDRELLETLQGFLRLTQSGLQVGDLLVVLHRVPAEATLNAVTLLKSSALSSTNRKALQMHPFGFLQETV